ncbi:MAG: hypothetical protein ACKO56_01200 [Paracoccaceae bacterium]
MSESLTKSQNAARHSEQSLLNGGQFALGLVTGGTVVLVFSIWLSMEQLSKPGDSTLTGAIIGGFLAGSISLIATVLTNYFMIKDSSIRKAEELERVASSSFQKLHSTRDTLVKVYRHYFDGSPDNVLQYGAQGQPARQVPKPLAFSNIDRRLSDDELSLPLALKEVALFNALGELDNFVSNYNNISNAYHAQFNRFQEILLRSPDTSFRGRHVTSSAVTIHPIEILALEDLRDHLLQCVRHGMPLAVDTHNEMISVMQRHFGRRIEFVEDPTMTGHVSFATQPR